jgi:hypothetical protein
MNYLIGIPYVNRNDLLWRALESVKPHWKQTLVIANCGDDAFSYPIGVSVLFPPVPLTATQSINTIIQRGKESACPFVIFMHSDAEAVDGAADKLIEAAENAEGKWGVLFTHYDSMVAFNMKAVADVGLWDTNFSGYFSDCDYYRRMRLAGWECRDTGIYVKHEGSATIRSDPKLGFLNRVTFNLYKQYYISKWGGDSGEEKWEKPWDGDLENL